MSESQSHRMTRRAFMGGAAACGAQIALLAAASPARAARLFLPGARARIVAREPWARIERVADGVWAVVSTPLEDRTTLCNGGIIRGRSGVLVIESYAQPAGAKWVAEQARELTGRWPDDVVITHYHGDHSAGITGFLSDGAAPRTRATTATRDRVLEQDEGRAGADPEKARLLAGSLPIEGARDSMIDLGDRTVRLRPRDGHTKSDVFLEVEDAGVVFCGDLVWNGMFPNYVDATPSRLSAAVAALLRERRDTVYVPGHGAVADGAAVRAYIAVLDHVEQAARQAAEKGQSAAEAASVFRLPEALGEWTLFGPQFPERAIAAWLRELV